MDEAQIACRYQEANARERVALMEIPACRKVMADEIRGLLDGGRLRSVKRDTLAAALNATVLGGYGNLPAQEAAAALGALPLRLDAWNRAREAAANSPEPGRSRWDAAAEEAAGLRNRLLETYAPMTPHIRRRYLPSAPEHMEPDLEREGLLGMVRGLETFDPAKGRDIRSHLIGWATSAMVSFLRGTDESRARAASGETDPEEPAAASPKPQMRGGGFGKRLVFGGRPKGPSGLVRLDAPIDGDDGGERTAHESIASGLADAVETAERSVIMRRIAEMVEGSDPLARLLLGMRFRIGPARRLHVRPLPAADAFERLRHEAGDRFAARLLDLGRLGG